MMWGDKGSRDIDMIMITILTLFHYNLTSDHLVPSLPLSLFSLFNSHFISSFTVSLTLNTCISRPPTVDKSNTHINYAIIMSHVIIV